MGEDQRVAGLDGFHDPGPNRLIEPQMRSRHSAGCPKLWLTKWFHHLMRLAFRPGFARPLRLQYAGRLFLVSAQPK